MVMMVVVVMMSLLKMPEMCTASIIVDAGETEASAPTQMGSDAAQRVVNYGR